MARSLVAVTRHALAQGSIAQADHGAALARVEIFSDPAAADGVWSGLEAIAPASAYQTRAWLLPWYDTIARGHGMRPLISVAYDAGGEACGLLPLCVMNRGPLRLAEFAGGKDANYSFGLFRPGLAWHPRDLRRWFTLTARQAGERIDLFALVNQPEIWSGAANPLRTLGGQIAPSHGYCTTLTRDADAFVTSRTSAGARKKLRSKQRRLASSGKISFFTAADKNSASVVLAAFAAQKAQRMKDMGVRNSFADPQAEAFLRRAALDFSARGNGGLELHAMMLNDKVIATFGGATHQGRFSGMLNSIELDPAIARSSPGEQLLHWLIQAKCREGLTGFDLGAGAARYKDTWCETPEPLFDLYVPVTAAGWALYGVKASKRRLKRAIKDSAFVWALAQRLRKARA